MRLLSLLLFTTLLEGQQVRHLTILHSNDLHARLTPDSNHRGGFAYLATLVRAQRKGCRDCLYLNAGDLVQGTPVSSIFRGEPVFQIGNLLKFDAAAIGNHDFDYGYKQTEKFMQIAKYPLLSANIEDNAGSCSRESPMSSKK